MNYQMLLATAASVLALGSAAQAATVYQSVPSLTSGQSGAEWCADCYGGGTFEPLDQFTLGSAASITGFQLSTYAFGGYDGLGGFTVEIYDAAHAAILFSQAVTPSLVSFAGQDDIVSGALTGLNLSAGTYWIGFIAPTMGVTGFNGGNGSLIDTTPHTGVQNATLGGNLGYALTNGGAVPEPATWALMIGGFGLAGVTLRSRRRQALTA
jgi:opacity protein-like surface antigen